VIECGLCQDASGRVVGAKKKHIQGFRIGHGGLLIG